ncbi:MULTISPECIES: DbpA RNA binding domain-containing protein [unclassified Treponema]|uniref:DbpA RNA binding domain-containing protein n=1 Tax=unclassified Treponema TaxID=2638727 RepID=UPI0020A2FD56|nr:MULTISPECIES: DbpA RNA binding domain-containing protein [unclassified Treponema]UTC66372.1 DbpA RNA binding domain-containing protein [Treponema sp. OMZ 789]UTC69102.1 DbpA RNA binding domain-containing protein [Treponema sp. OMZ 790]UTC71814.1 DbpA RNA binding domain-containing protein [Treponema sp. OMZ 791]
MSNKIRIENEEQLISSLKDVIEAIKTQENPEELNLYRRIFKKAVPLTMRSYVAAYLIKQAGIGGNRIYKKDGRNGTGKNAFKQTPARPARPKVILAEDESTSLFIGVGRKRGIFPKDIITLLIQGAGISREHIGDIRILDNYCFVQVMEDEAETIIEKLNNSYYRGKNLTVSHSRRPEDEEDNFEEPENFNTVNTESCIETETSDIRQESEV